VQSPHGAGDESPRLRPCTYVHAEWRKAANRRERSGIETGESAVALRILKMGETARWGVARFLKAGTCAGMRADRRR